MDKNELHLYTEIGSIQLTGGNDGRNINNNNYKEKIPLIHKSKLHVLEQALTYAETLCG